METAIVIITELIIGLVYLGIYFTVDALITRKKIKRNQMLWDEYSKDMSTVQKSDCFIEWLEENKARHGDRFYYIPRL